MELKQAPTSAEIEILLCCSRTRLDGRMSERLGLLLRRDLDWEYLIGTAARHGILPLLYSNLRQSWLEAVPKTTLDQLRDRFRANVQHNFFVTAELLKLLKAFEAHGIPAIPFKGPLLAASAYGDLTLRQFSDLDILVHKQNIVKAGELIISQGYTSSSCSGDDSGQIKDVDEVAYVGPAFHTFYRPDGRSRVDLQWRVTDQYFSFSLDDEHSWQRLAPVPVGGRVVRTFAPAEMLVILCVHGSKHRWEKLKWVCDVAELVRAYQCEIDWTAIQQEASRRSVKRMLGLGLLLAHELLGMPLPERISKSDYADARVKWVAHEIRDGLFVETGKPSGNFETVVFYLRIKDRWQDSAHFCFRYVSQWFLAVITPCSIDRQVLPLPASLSFVYFFVRSLRLLVKYSAMVTPGMRRKIKKG